MSTGIESYRPLAGVRIIDLSRLIVGALTTVKLADLGAEVVKVEPPGLGDYLRTIPPMVEGEGVWHTLLNRNKKSVALDIVGSAEDRATLMRLIDVADVVVDVSRPGGLRRLGIDIEECRRLKPQLTVCSISPFGQTGAWAGLPAHGLNLDSMGGATAISGERGDEDFVQLAYTGLGQESAAHNGALAVVAGVFAARATGQGVWVDISCWDSVVDMNRAAISYLASTGRIAQEDYAGMWGTMHRIYRSKDDKRVFVAFIERKFWYRFCEAVDRPDLLAAWHGEEGGVDYGDFALRDTMEALLASRTADEWLDLFVRFGLPGSPLLQLRDVIDADHFQTRGMLEQTAQPIANVASPIRWMDRPGERPGAHPEPAPKVGEDTEEVLSSWLGDV